jgi:CheY-like chemotaxis protein
LEPRYLVPSLISRAPAIEVAEGDFDVAVIDINLRDEAAYDIADELRRGAIPFVFATGY